MATSLNTVKFFWPIGDCINGQVPVYVDVTGQIYIQVNFFNLGWFLISFVS